MSYFGKGERGRGKDLGNRKKGDAEEMKWIPRLKKEKRGRATSFNQPVRSSEFIKVTVGNFFWFWK